MGVTSYYSFGGEIIGEETGGVRRDYLTDALGSVTATVTGAGTVENTYRYKPYGETLAKTGVGIDPKFLWNGKRGSYSLSPTSSLKYNRARFYDSYLGLWIKKDPLGIRVQFYNYVENNPTSLTDPSGLVSCKDENCCDDGGAWYRHNAPRCQGGSWVNCPNGNEVAQKCSQLQTNDTNCGALRTKIEQLAYDINKFACREKRDGYLGGGFIQTGQNPDEQPKILQWGAATHCCTYDNGNKSKFCSTKCCSNDVSDWDKSPISACFKKCLLFHEKLHGKECNKLPPIHYKDPKTGEGQSFPPYSECCAGIGQLECMMLELNRVCGKNRQPPPTARKLIDRKSELRCQDRY